MEKVVVIIVLLLFVAFLAFCIVRCIIDNNKTNNAERKKPSGQYSDNQKNIYSQR